MIQISSDGPNVNLAFSDILKEIKDHELNDLIFIQMCGLCTMHRSLQLKRKHLIGMLKSC